jgi:hypothetical protein
MKKGLITIALMVLFFNSQAQIVINEASNRNYTQVTASDGDQYDWFELYNSGSSDTYMGGWGISDNKNLPCKWIFPNFVMIPGKHLLVFASGLNIKQVSPIDHWESAILPSDTFHYLEPSTETPGWNTLSFDDSGWGKGLAGFGFGDDDDNTITSTTSPVVYIRRIFNIPDTNAICDAILHVDYDDGFVAYLNGTEIARNGVSGIPLWDSLASKNHEALMWQGRNPEEFQLDMSLIRSIWKQGDNAFAIEVHNVKLTSTDLSLIPFLSFGITTSQSFFQPVPAWFNSATGVNLHTNFKIDSGGENLYLSTPDSVITDSLILPRIPLNASIGRITDGANTFGIFLLATPGESNNTSQVYTNGYEPTPQFNVAAGFYTSVVNVSISTASGTAQIRYTTDGSEPILTSTLYNGTPIKITSTKTLKAKSFSTVDKLPGSTKTATYFINKTHTLPVISITTNNENLYGSSGIFDHWQETWNKPCYIEYFDNNEKLAFNQEAGIQIDGGAGGSRERDQHSVRIEPGNGTFGDGDVEYNLIPDRPNRNKYSSFYLRNGSNQYFTLQYKDGIQVKAIAKNTYTYYSAYTPIVVYLNGSYFGLYELREKLNADFLAQNYLMDNDSLDLLTLSYYKGQVLEALEGSTDQFWADFEKFKTLSPSSSIYLEDVSKFLDLDNYTDYIIAESWIGNNDWPNNNIRVFRNKSTNYKWRFAVQDVELSMQPNGWTSSNFDHIGYMLGSYTDLPYSGYWVRLMRNNSYKISFINRFADLMNTNYLFSNIGQMEEDMYNLQYPEMAAEFARWINSNISSFTSNHNILRSQLGTRSDYVRQHLQSHYGLSTQIEVVLDVQPAGAGQIKISTITPVNYPWSGIYFSNNPVKITAIANPGYKFTGWDNNPVIDDLDNNQFIATMTNDYESFTANFEFSNDAFKGVTISEVHYKNGTNENSTDWVEIYNGGDTKVNLKGWYLTDKDSLNKFIFNDLSSLEANSRIVVARNTATFSSKYPDVSNYMGPLGFKLGSPVDAVKLYDNSKTLVAEVYYSDIYPWPLDGDESGKTLELKNPTGNLSDPTSWFAGCIGGSPGLAYSPCPTIVGTEPLALYKSSLSAYPLPANDYINLDITLENSSKNCILKIYNIFGSEVKSIKYGYIDAGTYSTTINLSDIPAGLLILDLQSEHSKQSIKIVHLE